MSSGRKILIAVDGSLFSDEAFKWYCEFMRNIKDDHVTLIHVKKRDDAPISGPLDCNQDTWDELFEASQNSKDGAMKEMEEKYRQKAKAFGIENASFKLVNGGNPGAAICKYAKTHKVELIIIGTRGLGSIKRTLLGSFYEMHRVFCYGTLRKGFTNHSSMQSVEGGACKLLGTAKTADKFSLCIATEFNIPYLFRSLKDNDHIIGEVYEVNDKTLARLDEIEAVPIIYQREEISVVMDDSSISCLCYILNDHKPELESLPLISDYSKYCEESNKVFIPPTSRPPNSRKLIIDAIKLQKSS